MAIRRQIDRIDKMEKDQAALGREVIAIAGEMAIAPTSGAVLDLAHMIDDRVRNAAMNHARLKTEGEKLDAARERQRGLTEALAIHEKRIRDDFLLCSHFP